MTVNLEDDLKNAGQTPKRVKVTGSYFRGQVPDGATYVGRAAPRLKGSPFNNPHTASPKGCGRCRGLVHTRDEAISMFRRHLDEHPDLVEDARRILSGFDLACWCGPDEACHADVLIELIYS